MIVYLNGTLVPIEEASVSVLDRGFLFGDGVYEVVRCYAGRWFRLEDHANRLQRSLAEIGLTGFDVGWMEGIGRDLLTAHGRTPADAILYLQITRGADRLRSHVHPEGMVPTVFGMIREWNSNQDPETASVICLEDWRWSRCDIKSVSLLGHALAANESHRKGADEAVLVRKGVVTEGASTNIAIIREGTVMTHPESPHILSGISRKVVLEICAELKIPFQERSFGLDDLKRADEVFLMGTTHEVWPVSSIDGHPVPVGSRNGVTWKLKRRFSELTVPANLPG